MLLEQQHKLNEKLLLQGKETNDKLTLQGANANRLNDFANKLMISSGKIYNNDTEPQDEIFNDEPKAKSQINISRCPLLPKKKNYLTVR
jgi:hypothetical protein